LVPRIMELLKANGQEKVKVFLGGIIPDEDVPKLINMGIKGVFGPGTSTERIVEEIRKTVSGM
jgi:methylmalonyl-CoA mutase C-terminal domain/subunit